MKPIKFPQAKVNLTRPNGMTDEECSSLPVFRGNLKVEAGSQPYCLSCWQPTWKERLSILIFGKIWVYCISGMTQPPLSLMGTRNVFKELFFQGDGE